MISRCCDGCELLQECKVRFAKVKVNEFVACPNGQRFLVDSASLEA